MSEVVQKKRMLLELDQDKYLCLEEVVEQCKNFPEEQSIVEPWCKKLRLMEFGIRITN